jgi:hypothetical protein
MDLTALNGIIEAMRAEELATSSNHKRLTELTIKALEALKVLIAPLNSKLEPVKPIPDGVGQEWKNLTATPAPEVPEDSTSSTEKPNEDEAKEMDEAEKGESIEDQPVEHKKKAVHHKKAKK